MPNLLKIKPERHHSEESFPRMYRVDARTRRIVNCFLLFFVGLFVLLTALQLARTNSRQVPLQNLILTDLGVALLAVWLGSSYNKRVILYRDGIKVVGWFSSRKLNRDEIRGWRTSASARYGGFGYILDAVNRKRSLALPPCLHTDAVFRNWIKTVPGSKTSLGGEMTDEL